MHVDISRRVGLSHAGTRTQQRKPGHVFPLVARDGGAVVLRKSNQLEVLAQNRLDDGFDASPAIAGSQMFLRGRRSLYCLSNNR